MIYFSRYCLFSNKIAARLLVVYFFDSFTEMLCEDIENDIPVNNIQLSQGHSSVNVKVVKTSVEGFTETKIERVRLQSDKFIAIARPFCSSRPISNTISLSIEDVKGAMQLANSWRVYDVCFRKVLVYGKVDVLNYFSRNDKITKYRFLVDDGSGTIIATLNITKESVNAGRFVTSD